MNKTEFVKELAARARVTQHQARVVLDAMPIAMLTAFRQHDDVRLGSDFGIFAAKVIPAHAAISPRDGTTVQVPPKARLKFKAGKAFLDTSTAQMVR